MRTHHRPARRRKPLLGTLLLLSLIIFALIALLNWVVMPLWVGRGRETTVPNVVGMDRFRAESTLVAAGLRLGEMTGSTNAMVKPDHVISQSPAPGQTVKLGRRVRLDLSKGAGRLKLPHTEGLSVARAMALLSEAGFVVASIESLRAPNLPPGQVVSTRPAGGTDANQGDPVVIEVASRSGGFPMPNLVGMAVDNARRIIAAQGLVVGEVKQAPSDEPAGSVLIQYPEEGMVVRDGDTVAVIIAVPPGKNQ